LSGKTLADDAKLSGGEGADVKRWRIDRVYICLSVILFFYLWDLAFFLGIRDPARLPHPFFVFTTLGDIKFLRGFTYMLREIIFSFVSGGLMGVAIGASLLYSPWLTEATLRFLRISLWVPLLLNFAGTAPLILEITTAMLCTVYHYLAARSFLDLQARDAWIYAAREALLQTLLVSLLAQLWVENWRWFGFLMMNQPGMGLPVFAVLAALVGFINWGFRASFVLTATRHALSNTKSINAKRGKSIYQFIALAVASVGIWQLFGPSGLTIVQTTPVEVMNVVHQLFLQGEIWGHLGVSLWEVSGGISLGGLLALGLLVPLPMHAGVKKVLVSLFPLTYISAIVLWLMAFTWVGVNVWHKVIAVACFTFFPLLEALWGMRKYPFFYRVLLATDAALPIAFVAMIFGEAWAATQGLGFAMIVANATLQTDKVVAVFLVTFAVLIGLSSSLRWSVKRLFPWVEVPETRPT
jgi:sulfonate transport system permease protein